MNIAVMFSERKLLLSFIRSVYLTAIGTLMLFTSINAGASTTGNIYTFDVHVTHASGAVVYSVKTKDLPYSFNAAIHSPPGTPNVSVDIYFGALAPNGMTLSWLKNGDTWKLVTGFQPLLTAVELVGGQDNNTSFILGRDIQYLFTGTESKGMYLVYAVFVRSGTNPSNIDNWVGVSMTPLFVE
jgi:hypothetical protein